MKNILSENMLRFGTKNLSEATIRRLTEAEDPIDPAAIGFPNCPAKTVKDFVDWYIKYLTPSTGCVGQTLLIMKPEFGSFNLYEKNLVASIVGKVTVASSFNFSYRSGKTDPQGTTKDSSVFIWDTAATRNYDWAKQTVKISDTETYLPGLYNVHDMVDATLSLVPNGGVAVQSYSIPVLVGGTDSSQTIDTDPISKKKAGTIKITQNGNVSGAISGAPITGIFPWVDLWTLMPTNLDGYGFTMAAGGIEVPIQTDASMKDWIAKNMKNGKYIGPKE